LRPRLVAPAVHSELVAASCDLEHRVWVELAVDRLYEERRAQLARIELVKQPGGGARVGPPPTRYRARARSPPPGCRTSARAPSEDRRARTRRPRSPHVSPRRSVVRHTSNVSYNVRRSSYQRRQDAPK